MVNRLNKPRRGKPIKKGSRAGQFLTESYGLAPRRGDTKAERRAGKVNQRLLRDTFRIEDTLKGRGIKISKELQEVLRWNRESIRTYKARRIRERK